MNYSETKTYLKRYLKAKIPVIIVDSCEKARVIRMIKELASEMSKDFGLYQYSFGVTDLMSGNSLSDDKTIMSALEYVSNEIKYKKNYNFILGDISDVGSSTTISKYLFDLVTRFEATSSCLIIISNEPIMDNIAKMGLTLKLSYPDNEELEKLIRDTISRYSNQIRVEWDDLDYVNAASYLRGLSEVEAKNIISSYIANGAVTKENLKELKYTKQNLFSNIAGLEAIKVEENMQIAGLDYLKDWLNEKKIFMNSSKKEELIKRNLDIPRGILLVGVPGCGKSLCAKVTSNIFNVPLYRLDLATVQGQFVGQSEAQLKAALDTAEFVSPCVLWIDEIEKGLKQDYNSTTTKMVGQFLFWLQECKKPVFVIATANNVDDLPPELIRKGRFDEIFFVDLPNRCERSEVIKLYAKKYLKVEISDAFLERLVTITDNFASSDIEATIRAIAYKLIANQDLKLSENLIESELSKVYSLYRTNPEKVERIREWGRQRATKASKED